MKELSQEQVFKIIKDFANEIKKESLCGGIPNFFETYPQIDFEQLQQQAEINGFHIKRACDITTNDNYYKNEWNETKSIIIYFCDESLL